MKRVFAAVLLATTLLPFSNAAPKEAAPAMPKVGDVAPDFKLAADTGKEVSLSDYRGKKQVVLAFYIFAFTGG